VITLETVREYVENKKGTISEEHWLLLGTFVDKLILRKLNTTSSIHDAIPIDCVNIGY